MGSEFPYKLPKGWVWTRLGEIRLDSSRAITPSKEPEQMFELYSVPRFEIGKPEIIFGKEVGSNKQVVEEETVLLCKINPRINRVWIVGSYSSWTKIASTEWISFSRIGGINPLYLYYFMCNSKFREFLTMNVSGVGGSLMRVKASTLSQYPFPLPLLSEQQRIVAKIEELFTRLDAGVEALKKVKAELKRYRQAVLKHAFEGKLTQEWRKTHKDELEPASVLLERIKEERKKNAKGKFEELPPIDTSNLPELPGDWVWIRVNDIGSSDRYAIVDGPFGSHLKISDYVKDGEIPVISITNIDEGFDPSKLRYITKQKFEKLKRSAVKPGDIIMAKIGSSYGKCGYYPDWMPMGIIPANLLKITVSDFLIKSYVYYYLKSKNFKRYLDSITKSTAQPAFNVSAFKLLPIPFPSLAEQQKIVDEIERHLSVADEVEKTLEQSLKQAERLRQSILKEAFEGKLVPQDPGDEPAEKLLERIKDEKAKREAEVRTKKKSGKKKSPRQTELL